jgi:hypothetical protein
MPANALGLSCAAGELRYATKSTRASSNPLLGTDPSYFAWLQRRDRRQQLWNQK